MNQYNLNGIRIDPSVYQHPAEKKASEAIVQQGAFQKALEFISKNSVEKQMGVLYRASLAQLTPGTAPNLFKMAEEACDMFGVATMPEMFLTRTYSLPIQVQGIKQPMMILSTELLRQVDDRVLWGLLAAMIAGIRTGYCEIRLVESLCAGTGLLPDAVALPLKLLFQNWAKFVQFTCDRSNLIATGDLNTSMCGILAGQIPMQTLKGINFKDPDCDYMKQSREFLERTGHWTETVRDIQAFTGAGAFNAARYMNLYRFANGDYYDILEDYAEG